MITCQLTHNPYLLTTDVLFNGHEPKVNSAVEKFEGRPLVDWAKEIPRTFYDEMNGYDFDFYFTGTDADYIKVRDAFRNQGIDGEAVRIVREGRLEDVDLKRQEIGSLIAWLNEHRNRRFDFDTFVGNNAAALDDSIPYVVVHDEPVELEFPTVRVLTVASAFDLADTDLTSTPVLMTVNEENRLQFREELQYILTRRDVGRRQLFFLIDSSIDLERAIRIISDLGVRDPQVVERPDDIRVAEYLSDYPEMEHVRAAITVLRRAVEDTRIAVSRMDRFKEATNANARDEITSLADEIRQMRTSIAQMDSLGTYASQQGFNDACTTLENKLYSWRYRKAQGTDQINRAASDFVYELGGWVDEFLTSVNTVLTSETAIIHRDLAEMYASAGSVPPFLPSVAEPYVPDRLDLPNIEGQLRNLTETTYGSARSDFFSLFGASMDGGSERTPVEVANFDAWRSLARKTVMPVASAYVSDCEGELTRYYAELIDAYMQRLRSLTEDKDNERERAASRLSDTEQGLQEDRDWLNDFEERLLQIERG